MKYIEFEIENFKGIKKEKIKLDVKPEIKIFTLVGLNESGKTSFLQAIDAFQNGFKNKDTIIPKDKKRNFNDTISISATVALDEEDVKKIKLFCLNKEFILKGDLDTIKVTRKIEYKSSKPTTKNKFNSTWLANFNGNRKGSKKKATERLYDANNELWLELTNYIENNIFPKIILYSNFLFDIPQKVYLAKKNKDETTTPKHLLASDDQYFLLVQDVLDSLGEDLNIEDHLVNRYLDGDSEDIDNITQVLNGMSSKVTEEVFQTWGRVSGIDVTGREVTFGDSIREDDDGYYLEIKLKEGAKTYTIQERSLGFRWFFAFLSFTQFRKFRNGEPSNTLFLLDEPASNLHQTGQQELLTMLESLTDKSTVVYSTHSHHLISPKWLSGAYIVKNNAIDPDKKALSGALNLRDTDIKIDRYFNFAAQSPNQETHFQPILDVLAYKPSGLESIPNIIILEGKFDFYNFSYYAFCKNKKMNFYPGNGAGSLDDIISLYLSWGRNFIVLLDADSAGHREKVRYQKDFGELVSDKVFCLDDVDAGFINYTTETLTSENDRNSIVKDVYGDDSSYAKNLFNTALQTKYINNDKFKFEKTSQSNFDKIITFLEAKLNS